MKIIGKDDSKNDESIEQLLEINRGQSRTFFLGKDERRILILAPATSKTSAQMIGRFLL